MQDLPHTSFRDNSTMCIVMIGRERGGLEGDLGPAAAREPQADRATPHHLPTSTIRPQQLTNLALRSQGSKT
jgi:hypothetical protein